MKPTKHFKTYKQAHDWAYDQAIKDVTKSGDRTNAGFQRALYWRLGQITWGKEE